MLFAPWGVWTCAMSMHVISHFASFFERSLGYFSDHVAKKGQDYTIGTPPKCNLDCCNVCKNVTIFVIGG